MVEEMRRLRQLVTIGTVGGSDLVKQVEQLGSNGRWAATGGTVGVSWAGWLEMIADADAGSKGLLSTASPTHPPTRPCIHPSHHKPTHHPSLCPLRGAAVLQEFDYVFSENGLVAYKAGQLLAVQVRCWLHAE